MKSAVSIKESCYHPTRYPLYLLLLTCLGWGAQFDTVVAQEHSFRVIDQVDLPPALGGGSGSGLFLELRELWILFPDRPAFLKETSSMQVKETEAPAVDMDSLEQRLQARIGQLPIRRGKAVVEVVEYEFNLLDPHMMGAGMRRSPEPDSMDRSTRELQAALIELVKGRSRNIDRYHLEEQLLSVRFHETWSFDPASMSLDRQVNAITPVIWQRRRTVEGEPVNDAETGWPVYYKNSLSRIDLRNP